MYICIPICIYIYIHTHTHTHAHTHAHTHTHKECSHVNIVKVYIHLCIYILNTNKMTKKMQDEELEILRGDKDIDESLLEAQLNGKGADSRI